ncbi:MAG: DUF4097 family beta strand repeat-containing protein [Planctomycetota bacterium]
MSEKSLTSLCCVSLCLVAATGCHVNFSSGYSFDYRGEEVEKSVDGSVDSSVTAVHIHNRFGDIDIAPTDGEATWSWTAKCWASQKSDAETFLAQLSFQTSQVGDELHWTVVMPEPDKKLRGVKSNLTLRIPAELAVTASDEHGDILVTGLPQDVKLANRHGDVTVNSTSGVARIENRHGNVYMKEALGHAEINCEHGDIGIDGASEVLQLQSRHGEVKVVNSTNEVISESAHTNVSIQSSGAKITCQAQHGGVTIDVMGDSLESVASTLRHGSIRVMLPNEMKARLKFDVEHGRMTTDVDSSDSTDDPLVEVSVEHGNISISRKDGE